MVWRYEELTFGRQNFFKKLHYCRTNFVTCCIMYFILNFRKLNLSGRHQMTPLLHQLQVKIPRRTENFLNNEALASVGHHKPLQRCQSIQLQTEHQMLVLMIWGYVHVMIWGVRTCDNIGVHVMISKSNQIKSILFKLDSVRSGCPISRARGSCIKRSSILDRIGIQKCWFQIWGYVHVMIWGHVLVMTWGHIHCTCDDMGRRTCKAVH